MRKANLYLSLISLIALFGLSIESHAILHGTFDKNNIYESVVKIYGATPKRTSGLCSGVLIHPRVVLTASHWLDRAQFVVATNSPYKNTEKDKRSRVLKSFSPYEGTSYSGSHYYENDFAVLILESEIKIERYPRLVSSDDEFFSLLDKSNQTLTLSGYGVDEKGVSNKRRMYNSAKYVDLSSDYTFPYYENLFFTEKVATPGDSGGGAFIESDGQLYLMGMITGGNRKIHSRLMKVFAQENWLNDQGLFILNSSKTVIDSLVKNITGNIENEEDKVHTLDIMEYDFNSNTNVDDYEFIISIEALTVFHIETFDKPVNMVMSVCNDDECFTFREKNGTVNAKSVLNWVSMSKKKFISIAPIGMLKKHLDSYRQWDYISLRFTNGDYQYGQIKLDYRDYLEGKVSYEKQNEFKEMFVDLRLFFRKAKK